MGSGEAKDREIGEGGSPRVARSLCSKTPVESLINRVPGAIVDYETIDD